VIFKIKLIYKKIFLNLKIENSEIGTSQLALPFFIITFLNLERFISSLKISQFKLKFRFSMILIFLEKVF
jgi:hypothetical protein